MQRIGLISDTHGLLRPEARDFLAGCDRILHAGDVCDAAVLDALAAIAPVVAVRGNNDRGAWADALPVTRTVAIEGVTMVLIHDVADLDDRPPPGAATIVIHGHSHRPAVVDRGGRMYINPGSAGPRRFRLPISIGELFVDGTTATPRLVRIVP
jgi:putative phosphoesterase